MQSVFGTKNVHQNECHNLSLTNRKLLNLDLVQMNQEKTPRIFLQYEEWKELKDIKEP